MKVTLDKTENRTSYLTVEAEVPEIDKYIEKVYQRLVKVVEVPGFNKGSAPRDALEKHVGRDRMIEDAMKEMASSSYPKIVKEQKLEAAMQPMVRIKQNEPPIFEMVVPLKPLVELGDYHSMHVEPESLEVKEEEVEAVLEGLRNRFAEHSTVGRSVQEGDLITIDIEGMVLESPFLSKNAVKFRVTPDFASDIPSLYEEMVGIKKGEEKEFKLKLPGDFANKLVAGKEASFKVKVYDIQETVLPELDDEFANKVAPGVGKLDMLKDRIKKNLEIEREQNAKSRFEEKVVQSLIEISKLEYPPIAIDMEARYLLDDSLQELRDSCKDEKEYEEKLKLMPEAILKEQALALAKKRALWNLVINEVAKLENIDVDDKEIDEKIEDMINGSEEEKKGQRAYLNDNQNRQYVYNLVKTRKTVDKLVEIVKAPNKM